MGRIALNTTSGTLTVEVATSKDGGTTWKRKAITVDAHSQTPLPDGDHVRVEAPGGISITEEA